MFFLFSRRRRHTRLQGDWSSDVCSSDLLSTSNPGLFKFAEHHQPQQQRQINDRRVKKLASPLDSQVAREPDGLPHESEAQQDRKSTRLNSSHLVISYAVFCLKKKKERCT